MISRQQSVVATGVIFTLGSVVNWLINNQLDALKEMLTLNQSLDSLLKTINAPIAFSFGIGVALLISTVIFRTRVWFPFRLKKCLGKTFRNCDVLLDGHHFEDCEFYNVTFIFRGNSRFTLTKNVISGAVVDLAGRWDAEAVVNLLSGLQMIKSEVPIFRSDTD